MSATRHLRRVDPVLAGVIERVGRCTFEPRAEGTHFDAVVRAIVYQQLSGRAAGTIHGRMLALYGGRSPTPAELLATPEEALRAAGLSRQKLAYLRDLAARAASGEIPFERLHELDDDAIIEALTSVKGVGRWTAQMFLMFRLGRPDVLPDLDLGIQNAIQRAYGMKQRPSPKQVLEIGARWSPYATVASWYLWRSLDVPDEPPTPAVRGRRGGRGAAKADAKPGAKTGSKARVKAGVKAVARKAAKPVAKAARGMRRAVSGTARGTTARPSRPRVRPPIDHTRDP